MFGDFPAQYPVKHTLQINGVLQICAHQRQIGWRGEIDPHRLDPLP
jgi:hypothetical protein